MRGREQPLEVSDVPLGACRSKLKSDRSPASTLGAGHDGRDGVIFGQAGQLGRADVLTHRGAAPESADLHPGPPPGTGSAIGQGAEVLRRSEAPFDLEADPGDVAGERAQLVVGEVGGTALRGGHRRRPPLERSAASMATCVCAAVSARSSWSGGSSCRATWPTRS